MLCFLAIIKGNMKCDENVVLYSIIIKKQQCYILYHIYEYLTQDKYVLGEWQRNARQLNARVI